MNETTQIAETPKATISRLSAGIYFIWVLIIQILFYSESFGINALIATTISLPLFAWLSGDNYKRINWWIASIIWIFTAVGVYINGSAFSILCFYFAFFYFVAINFKVDRSLPGAIFQTLTSCAVGLIGYFQNLYDFIEGSRERKSRWLVNVLLVTIPLVIGLIFLKLYQAADKDFADLTAFINLDFISFPFLFTYLMLSIFMFGFFFHRPYNEIDKFEEEFADEISPTRKDKLEEFFGIVNEKKIGISMLIILNAMLVLYNILDVKFIAYEMHDPTSDSTLSEIVHSGVYSLIFSIVLVILIIAFILRGQLNFQHNKWIKPLILFWLFQNFFMIITTAIKNAEYISFWGLTYKRIGVFVYLFLAVIGLAFTAYKVMHQKSFWHLFKTTAIAFAICLSALLTFNWNRAIAWYNTTQVATERIDFYYLYELGPDTYAFIIEHHQEHNSVSESMLSDIDANYQVERYQISDFENDHSWLSYTWSDRQLKKEAYQYKFLYQ